MNLDNYSYKDTYHFKKDSHLYSNPYKPSSLDLDPKINDTIKENKGERTNVEIEGNELVLQPDLTGLHKARGKKHSKGGMEVLLKPDTFVFSDDPKLAFNKKDHELFEFKEGGSIASRKNTPAEVLKRQVDAKHYNSLINNINDVKKDATAKKSSQLMLEKYLEKLGNVAYLQEAKKGFPTGVPSFSQGTAPVYDANVKNEVEAEKQYARFGGAIMQRGGYQ
jgi:hypothetical protein